MVNCPNCGFNVIHPLKTWPIPSPKPQKEEGETKFVGIFECPKCKVRFRTAIQPETKGGETASIKSMVGRIRGIKEELMQTLVNLREKIKTLETERAYLMIEIENLRKVAESRVNALETEVSTLKEEVKSLRDLLGYTGEEK